VAGFLDGQAGSAGAAKNAVGGNHSGRFDKEVRRVELRVPPDHRAKNAARQHPWQCKIGQLLTKY
jgi:hypothetical protein